MKKLLLILVLAVGVSGCGSALESTPGFTHTAALTIGDHQDTVIAQAEHILAPSENTLSVKGITDMKIKRYIFTDEYNLVLYFYRGIFIQAGLTAPDSQDYPLIRGDYETVKKGSPGPKGYLVTKKGNTLAIKTLE